MKKEFSVASERSKITGLIVKNLLSPRFIELMEAEGLDPEYIHLHSAIRNKDGDKEAIKEIVFEQDHKTEVQSGVMHIQATEPDHLVKVERVLRKLHEEQ